MSMRSVLFGAVLFLGFQQLSYAGDSISDTRKVSSFTVLKITGSFNIQLTQGDNCSLVVGGDKAKVSAVQSKNMGVVLNITSDTSASAHTTLFITFKDINQITVNGNCKISSGKQVKADDLSMNLDGNTSGALDIKSKVFTFTCNTDKPFTVTGKADKGNAKVEGDGAIDMSALKVDDMNIEYASDTDIKIYAHPDLHVKMAGAGNLTYYGNPKVKVFKVNGTGQPVEGK